MVSSMTRKMISLAISLLVVVISLTGVALAASAPTVSTLTRHIPGFSGAPGKIARDDAGNFYVADFWGKGIMKLNRDGNKSGFIPTDGRPTGVAVMPDSRLVVATQAPASVAFYSQSGVAPNITGAKISDFGGTPGYRPVAITIDAAGHIYVLDAGDLTSTATNIPRIRVYSSTGSYLSAGAPWARINTNINPTTSAYNYTLKQPQGIAYESVALPAGHIIVADTMNGRLQFYNAYNGTEDSMTYVKTVGTRTSQTTTPANGVAALFAGPQEIALEYTASNVLDRIYVSEKSRDEIAVVDAVNGNQLMRISAANVTGSVTQPTGLFFEKTFKADGTTPAGILYAANALSSTSDPNVIAISIDDGVAQTLPALQIDPVTETWTSSTLPVSGTVSPVYDVYCSLNGGSYSLATPSGSTWNISISPLVSGNNWITCKSSNGSSDSSKTVFKQVTTYYTAAPATITLAIESPAEGSTSYTKNDTVLLSGTSTGTTIAIPGSTCAPVAANNTWSCSATLADGPNTINVTAAKQGAASVTKSVTVVKDKIAPVVVISALSEAAVTNDAIQNIAGIVSDTSPIGAIVVNGYVVPDNAKVTTGTDTYFSAPVTLVRGSNAVTVQATDAAGNLTVVPRAIVLNPEKPGLTVALPADNSFMKGVSSAAGSGLVDSSFTAVDACGSLVTPSSGNWATTTDFALDTGLNTCEFTASGGVNPTVKVKRTIINDVAYAKLAITSPAADMATDASSVVVSGSVASNSAAPTITYPTLIDGDVTMVTVTVSTYDLGTGNFSHTVPLEWEGTHTIMVTANATTKAVRNIIYDNTAPVLGIQADSRSMPPMISGSIEGSSKISAITAELDHVPVSIPLSVLTFGAYNPNTDFVVWHATLSSYAFDTISFTTTDPAGNETTRVRTAIIPKGDIDKDGYVRLPDALAVLRHAAGTDVLAGADFIEGDVGSLVDGRVSSDGSVNIIDAVLILQKAYGLANF